jgi:hypothetical protein
MGLGLQSKLLIPGCVGHHYADVIARVSTFHDCINSGFRRETVLKESRY